MLTETKLPPRGAKQSLSRKPLRASFGRGGQDHKEGKNKDGVSGRERETTGRRPGPRSFPPCLLCSFGLIQPHSSFTPPYSLSRPPHSDNTAETMEALQAESLLADSQPIRHRAHSHYIDLTASPSVSPTINPPVDTPFRQSGHFKTASSTLKSQSLGQHPIFKYQPTLNELQPVLKPSNIGNRPMPPATARDEWESFGSSLAKAKGLDTRNNPQKSTPDRSAPIPKGTYTSFIKPATPGAFDKTHGNISSSAFLHRAVTVKPVIGGRNDWPSWLTEGRPNPGARPLAASLPPPRPSKPAGDDNPAEIFNLDSAHLDAEDYVRHHGDPDKHMRELLSGAVGDGEDQMGDDQIKEGEDIVDGFANSVRLMPHQVRGTHWMRVRESGRKYGGILADVSYSQPIV